MLILPFWCNRLSWQDLKDHMRQGGNVSNVSIAKGNDGRSKGYGIAQYSTYAEQQTAINLLHDSELDGRSIICRADRMPTLIGGRKVYVGNLAWSVTWQDLKDHFRRVTLDISILLLIYKRLFSLLLFISFHIGW